MKLFNFFSQKKKNPRRIISFYQASIEKNGRDEMKKIVEKGLNIPVLLM